MDLSDSNRPVLNRLRDNIEKIVQITDTEWDYAVKSFGVATFKKDSFLLRAGEKPDRLFSLVKGLVRFYYITESGKEYNKYFVMDNRFFSSFSALFLNLPCGFYIQAFEETETITISKSLMEELYHRNPCWERYGRLIAISFIHHMEEREKEFLLDPLDVRYAKFLDEYPDLINRIPQYHIASYLGVTDVALSRLRNTKKLK